MPAGRFPPSAIAAWLAVGTTLIGALLAWQYAQQATAEATQVRNLLWAFLLAGASAVASILFNKGEAEKAEKSKKAQTKEAA